MGSKQCSHCETVKSLTDFGTQTTRGTQKVDSRCKSCASEIAKEWRLANRESYNAYFRERRKDEAKRTEADRLINRWKASNPERVQAHMAKGKAMRRARIDHTENKLTSSQWVDRVAEFNGHCAYCLKPWTEMHIEHMYPVARGGEHTLANVVPACGDCNRRKHTKTLLEFTFQHA